MTMCRRTTMVWRICCRSAMVAAGSGCIEAKDPTAIPVRDVTPGSIALAVSVSVRASRAPTFMSVIAGYARTSDPQTVLPLDTATVALGTASSIPVSIDVTACLSDAGRERSSDAQAPSIAGTCVLRLTVSLLDETRRVIDVATVEPLAARVGETTVVPSITLGARDLADAIAADASGTCVLTAEGEAYCWGLNSTGHLGTGDHDTVVAAPRRAAGGFRFRSIGMGGNSSCGLTATGAVYCWGANLTGEFGNGTTTAAAGPVPGGGGLRLESLSVGFGFVCGLVASGDAYCWGRNDRGQLGTGDTTSRFVPTVVPGGFKFAQISAGFRHTCGRPLSGTPAVLCWGNNDLRQLGLPPTAPAVVTAPSAVPTAAGVTFARAEAYELWNCGLSSSGAATCWGADRFGEAGVGVGAGAIGPTAVASALSFVRIVGGKTNLTFSGSCGWTAAGAGYCWGANRTDQLGADPRTTTGCTLSSGGVTTPFGCVATPQRIATTERIAGMAQGGEHACAITATRAVLCWGDNARGRLGVGSTAATVPLPALVIGIPSLP